MEKERERLVEELARLLDGESVAASELALIRAEAAVGALDAYLAAKASRLFLRVFSVPPGPQNPPPQTPPKEPSKGSPDAWGPMAPIAAAPLRA